MSDNTIKNLKKFFIDLEYNFNMVNKNDIAFLHQLNRSLRSAQQKLEEAYKNKSVKEFNKVKTLVLDIQAKILEMV